MAFDPSFFQDHAGLWLAVSGLAIGAGLGAVAERTGFCAMGGISDYVLMGDSRRLRAWTLAIGFAVLGAALLVHVAGMPLAASVPRQLGYSLPASAAGGLLFGIGMVFAGGCAFRNVVRAGSGDVAALLVVVVIGAVAAAALDGPLQLIRLAIMGDRQPLSGDETGLAAWLPGARDDARPWVETVLALLIGGTMLVVSLWDDEFRASSRHWLAGFAIGGLVTLGFLATTLSYDEFALVSQRPASATYVGPLVEAGSWLAAPWNGLPRFGAGLMLGTLGGAIVSALARGAFRPAMAAEAFDLSRRIGGAVLMGFGGVLAGGCTIGQGVTGMAMLSVGALVTVVFLVMGGVVGVWVLQRWYELET